MTFLQYVCEKLLGPPAHHGGSHGDSYWCCPFHNDTKPSFHTLPHKAEYPDYWKCLGCDHWGDELQLLRELRDIVGHPLAKGDYGDQKALLAAWRAEFEQLQSRVPGRAGLNGSTGSKKVGDTLCSSSPPLRTLRYPRQEFPDNYDPRSDEFEPATIAAVAQIVELVGPFDGAGFERLVLAEGVLRISARHGVHPAALAGQCQFQLWSRRHDAEHMASCHDPDCDYYCCRIARGWTPEQIRVRVEADRARRPEERAGKKGHHRIHRS
jgi:hypothetical protein